MKIEALGSDLRHYDPQVPARRGGGREVLGFRSDQE